MHTPDRIVLMKRPKALFVLRVAAIQQCYGPDEVGTISALVHLLAPPQTALTMALSGESWAHVEVLLSGWGPPVLTRVALARAPQLLSSFVAVGSVAMLMTVVAWARVLTVVPASAINAIPVAEYAVAVIVLSLKQVW